MTKRHNVLVIAGPTASGKSALAIQKATELGGVIINADSLQVYDALPILTARPSEADMQKIPHKLYGFLGAQESLTAMEWARRALSEIHAAQKSGLIPIIVGGTGFYIKTLMTGLSPIPDIPQSIRVMAQDMMDNLGIEAFFSELAAHDPVIATKIDSQNPQRLVRAMEVFLGTGKPLSYWQSLPAVSLDENLTFETHIVMPERDVLYQRIDDRFDAMVGQGAVDEVKVFDEQIQDGQIPFDSVCTHALGFEPLQQYVHGDIDLVTAIHLGKNETRHYAKRQVTWFRHQMDVAE